MVGNVDVSVILKGFFSEVINFHKKCTEKISKNYLCSFVNQKHLYL
jgi:hypothetical protein